MKKLIVDHLGNTYPSIKALCKKYDIPNTKAGKSAWQESIQKMNTEITNAGLTKGYGHENIMPELIRVMKRINIYMVQREKQP